MIQSRDDLNWYVARIKPGQSHNAVTQLDRANFSFNYPQCLDGNKVVPLIPGYIFLNLPDDEDVFASVTSLNAIDRFLPIGMEKPSAIPAKWMVEFFKRLTNGAFDVKVEPLEKPLPWFNKEETLGIISGPFTGHTGTFSHVRKGAVIVSVKFFGRTLEVPLKGHQVQRMM